MKQGTPEQVRQIRHRRRVVFISAIAGGFSWIIVSSSIGSYFGADAGLAATAFLWLFGGCGFMIFSITYWSCPVCKHYFPRGSNGRYCTECKTSFDA